MRKEYDFLKGKRGAVIASPGKTRITIMLDDDLIEHFRALAEAQDAGYQTLINATRKRTIDRPLTESVLRKVLREELDPRPRSLESTA
jgi:BrnA antitoxin of type II toxin-antitoxin system